MYDYGFLETMFFKINVLLNGFKDGEFYHDFWDVIQSLREIGKKLNKKCAKKRTYL